MRQKKKIRLKDSVKRRYVEFGTRNVHCSVERGDGSAREPV